MERHKKTPEQKALDKILEGLGKAAIYSDVYFELTGSPVQAEIDIELREDKWTHVARIRNDGERT